MTSLRLLVEARVMVTIRCGCGTEHRHTATIAAIGSFSLALELDTQPPCGWSKTLSVGRPGYQGKGGDMFVLAWLDAVTELGKLADA